MSSVLDVILLSTCWTHVLLAPFNKVEESFNLHATHDVLMYGVHSAAMKDYDHFVFPGAVPRTFLGSILLAWMSSPFIKLASGLGFVSSKFEVQVAIRLVLATCNAITFCLLRRGVSRRYGGPAGVLFVLLTCTQFHLPFWVGRTLPNMFALVPVNLASYLLLNRAPNSSRPPQCDLHRAISLLMFAAVVFRSEVAMFVGPIVLQALLHGQSTISKLLVIGVVAGVGSAALTVLIDSYFWQQPIWPELYGIYFNVVQGKSSEWGVSPFHTYFTSHLPKLLLGSAPLSVVGFILDARIRSLLIPAFAFISLLSFLGHKEWRFIVYVVPLFNIAAARGATWLISRRKGHIFGRICFLVVAGILVANLMVTTALTSASIANYPGGEALARFNELYRYRATVHVHISNFAAQTGASLFLQTNSPPSGIELGILPPPRGHSWVYNKTEHLDPQTITSTKSITHVIAECQPDERSGVAGTGFSATRWREVEVITGFKKWQLNLSIFKDVDGLLHFWDALTMVEEKKLAILERR